MGSTKQVAGDDQPARRPTSSGQDNVGLDRSVQLARRLLSADAAQAVLIADGTAETASVSVEDGSTLATRVEWVERVCAAVDLSSPLVVPDAGSDPRLAGLPDSHGALLAVPLLRNEQTAGALCVHVAEPRSWSPEDVDLVEKLATSAVGALNLTALTAEYDGRKMRWDLAIDAAGIGTFDLDLSRGQVEWDDTLHELFGLVPGETVKDLADVFRHVHAEDRVALQSAIDRAVEQNSDYRSEFRISHPAGTRWIAARGRTVTDRDGRPIRLLGVAYDITEVTRARDQAARVLSTMSTGFFSVDRSWRVTFLNAEGERILGRSLEQLVGRNLWDEFPGADEGQFGTHYRRAMDSGEPTGFEAYYPKLKAWYDVRAIPTADGLEVYFLDITKRRAAEEDAERVYERLELISAISGELAATLDAEEAVARLAQTVVPALADWCLVTVVDDENRLRDIGAWHADPQLRPTVEEYARLRVDALADNSLVHRALVEGKPQLAAERATEQVCAVLTSEEARRVLRRLAPETGLVLPLAGRDRTVGLLSLYSGPERGPFDRSALTTAREVAARAGLALDNARLYRQQSQLAEGLQRNLLTDPPQPDHIQIAVRYQPAAEAAAVGGDWYDAFLQADGATVLVIGDVVGHDVEAAAEMGQLRGLLRGIAFHSGAGPAEVLRGLDAAMEGLMVAGTATAVVARLEQEPEERRRGVTRVRWSNAGHPPPMVINPDGTVRVLAAAESDLLLGLDPTAERQEEEIVAERSATVLLYTDGLVERRGRSIDEGLAALRQALVDLADHELDELCDELLRRMLPQHAEDDVALVAVRLHPQDRRRPAEAGPNRVPDEVPPEPGA